MKKGFLQKKHVYVSKSLMSSGQIAFKLSMAIGLQYQYRPRCELIVPPSMVKPPFIDCNQYL